MIDLVMQNWQIFALAAGLIFTLLIVRLLNGESYCPYEPRESLLTRNEQKFYFALREVVQEEYPIFAMVRIADLLRVKQGEPKRQSWQNRINAKHIDFVLCDAGSLEPVLAIEVDDRSHQRADRRKRDEFVNDAFEAADLPLMRIKAQASYPTGDVRAQLKSAGLSLQARAEPAIKRRRIRRRRSDANI
ncbi:MAG: DUF2726 domain-containing protein [Pirellulaceae bacterium]|nr:DUF2726 domain-containing protein [Pirellulaceae bacterium]